MKLHRTLTNGECIGRDMSASIGENCPWVQYDGEHKFVVINGHCAYMDGEVCRIVDYNEFTRTVTMYCEDGASNAVGEFDGVFTIPYEQYLSDFGTEWMS